MLIPMPVRSGFTLVEALVALAVFALIAGAGATILSVSIDNRFAVHASTGRTAALQRTRALLKADLGQAAPRRTRDRNGEPQPMALAGAMDRSDAVLTLTRTGWSNPGGLGRSSLQRVEYRLVGDRLERRVSAFLDGSSPGPPQVLLSGVSDLTVSFIEGGRETPVPVPGPTGSPPDAVRVSLTLEDFGRFDQLFLIGGGR